MLQTVSGTCEGMPWTAQRRRATRTGWPKNESRRMTVPTWEVHINGHRISVADMSNVSASDQQAEFVAFLNDELTRRWTEWG